MLDRMYKEYPPVRRSQCSKIWPDGRLALRHAGAFIRGRL